MPSPKFTFQNHPSTQKDDDTSSSFKGSTATNGGSLATRVCLVISRILTTTKQLCVTDEEVCELSSLITEVNMIDTLSLKHSTVNKVLALLCEKSSSEQTLQEKVQQSQKMQFKSKLKLELKSM